MGHFCRHSDTEPRTSDFLGYLGYGNYNTNDYSPSDHWDCASQVLAKKDSLGPCRTGPEKFRSS